MIDDRRELVVTKPWSAEMAALIGQGAADRLVLNYALGFNEADLDFPFAPLAELTSISMKDRPRLRSLTGLAALPALTNLGLFLAQKLADISELRGRANLENVDLQSCRKITSTQDLEGCTGLRRLNLAEGGDLETAGPLNEW